MKIQLSDHFDYRRLLCFTAPSIVMMLFTSFYSVVDGYFISNFCGKTAFGGVNFSIPFLMILSSVGLMLGTGGSALIGMFLGQQRKQLANHIFSMLVTLTVFLGIAIACVGACILKPLLHWMGAEGELLHHALIYAWICLPGLPFLMLQMEFHSFCVLAEKPKLGLGITVASGVTNMVLDAVLVAGFSWGVPGAAIATVVSQLVGGLCPLIYFLRPNSSLLRLTRTRFYPQALKQTCLNGSSEMVTHLSMSLVSMVYNVQLLKYAGTNGVTVFGVLMYLGFVFISCFIGYAIGTAPVVSYHFGAGNHGELHNILKKSFSLILVASFCMTATAELLAMPLARFFTGYDADLMAMTEYALRIYAFAFLLMGIPVFASSFFTALNDGITSGLISLLRSLVFELAAVLLLPLVWGLQGIWYSLIVAELAAMFLSLFFLFIYRKKYHYWERAAVCPAPPASASGENL